CRFSSKLSFPSSSPTSSVWRSDGSFSAAASRTAIC
ncbi:MAG: hypothetical protein AVDCRST_MAG23-2886, partial [uncultured Sphingosinicella sp.]